MKEKKKKKRWKWLFFGIGLTVLICAGILFAGMNERMSLYNLYVPKQAQGFVQDTFQKGKDFAGNLDNEKYSQHGPNFGKHGEEKMEHRNGHHHDAGILLWGFGGLFALLLGWYLRRVKGKKGLGNLIIFIGALPLLPIILVGLLAYWLVKKVRSGKTIAAAEFVPGTYENSINAQLLEEWERKLKVEEK